MPISVIYKVRELVAAHQMDTKTFSVWQRDEAASYCLDAPEFIPAGSIIRNSIQPIINVAVRP